MIDALGRRVSKEASKQILSKDIWCAQAHAGKLFSFKEKSLSKKEEKSSAIKKAGKSCRRRQIKN